MGLDILTGHYTGELLVHTAMITLWLALNIWLFFAFLTFRITGTKYRFFMLRTALISLITGFIEFFFLMVALSIFQPADVSMDIILSVIGVLSTFLLLFLFASRVDLSKIKLKENVDNMTIFFIETKESWPKWIYYISILLILYTITIIIIYESDIRGWN